jgi:hypothetical protein
MKCLDPHHGDKSQENITLQIIGGLRQFLPQLIKLGDCREIWMKTNISLENFFWNV